MLCNADAITVEGRSYQQDIPKVFRVDKPISYFPNITYCNDMEYVERGTDTINLIYFGRITRHKGVDILLRTMPLLGDCFRLFLAGPIENDIKPSELKISNVFYLGSLSPIELSKTMEKCHIFMFPTKWSGEGQSNSLIEAMQKGLVPIVSEQGFNRDVVGDCGIILPQGSSEYDYKDAVLKCARGDLEEQGEKAMRQIVDNHNIEKWIPWLINQYKSIGG